jgi:hypothetical protein
MEERRRRTKQDAKKHLVFGGPIYRVTKSTEYKRAEGQTTRIPCR